MAHIGFVLLTYITSSKSSVWCVGYYYPTNYGTELILQIQSFPEGRGTLFTCVPILVYTYKEFVLYMATYAVCLLYREILCLECQPSIYFTV